MQLDLNDCVNGESVGESIGTVLFDSSIDSREGEMLETIYCNWADCLKFSCSYGFPLTFIKKDPQIGFTVAWKTNGVYSYEVTRTVIPE